MSGTQIQIQSRSDDEFVDASLLDGMAPQDLLLVEREWLAERSLVAQELLRAGVERAKWPQSLHWNWSKKTPQLKSRCATSFAHALSQKRSGKSLQWTFSGGYERFALEIEARLEPVN